jgi:hypothetical protein
MSGRRLVVDAETLAELEAIDVAREEAFVALHEANQRGVTGTDAYAVLEMFAVVDQRTESLQHRAWPRYEGRLVVALGEAILVSPTGRSSRLLWERGAR